MSTDEELRDALATIRGINPAAATPSNVADLVIARRLDARARELNAAEYERVDGLIDHHRARRYEALNDALIERWLGNIDPLACNRWANGEQVDAFERTVREIVERARSAAYSVVYELDTGEGE